MGGILDDAEAIVGKSPKDDRGAEHTSLPQNMQIKDMGDTDKHKSQDLAAETTEADSRTELMIVNRTHHAGDVVDHNEDKKRV